MTRQSLEGQETEQASRDQLLEESPTSAADKTEENGSKGLATNLLGLHIDIQVHIDPRSSAEQIDHIFASMAKHLYGIKV